MPLITPSNSLKRIFHLQINRGPVQIIHLQADNFKQAAIASLSICSYEKHSDYDVVKIWTPACTGKARGPFFVGWNGKCDWSPAKSRRW